MKMKILIISGGNIDFDFALDFLAKYHPDETIAVDGGLAFLDKVGQINKNMPNITHIVGDFDTIEPEILEKYKQKPNITIHSFNPEKDYTDTDIALKLAMKLGEGGKAVQITLLGATGTRLDHVLANMQLLIGPLSKGMECILLDAHNRVRMIQGHFTLKEPYGKYISLIPVTMVLKGIDLKGFKYPLTDRTMVLGESLCVSNELSGRYGEIYIREGIALLIESMD